MGSDAYVMEALFEARGRALPRAIGELMDIRDRVWNGMPCRRVFFCRKFVGNFEAIFKRLGKIIVALKLFHFDREFGGLGAIVFPGNNHIHSHPSFFQAVGDIGW